jgi:hypothetical protein
VLGDLDLVRVRQTDHLGPTSDGYRCSVVSRGQPSRRAGRRAHAGHGRPRPPMWVRATSVFPAREKVCGAAWHVKRLLADLRPGARPDTDLASCVARTAGRRPHDLVRPVGEPGSPATRGLQAGASRWRRSRRARTGAPPAWTPTPPLTGRRGRVQSSRIRTGLALPDGCACRRFRSAAAPPAGQRDQTSRRRLGSFDEEHRVLTLSALARRAGLATNMTLRLAGMLVVAGALVREEGIYPLNPRLYEPGTLSGPFDLRRQALLTGRTCTSSAVNKFCCRCGSVSRRSWSTA